MLSNYLKIILRNLRKHRLFGFINIFGLATGFAACLLIFLYIQNELAFDGFHENRDQIYRLNEIQTFDGTDLQKVSLSMFPMGPTMQEEYPEILNYCRFIARGNESLNYGDKQLYLDKIYMVDTSFFSMFDFRLKTGDEGSALAEPNSIVITEKTAERFFNTTEDAIGKEFRVPAGQDTFNLRITGILNNVPQQSHLQFDAIVSLSTMGSEAINQNMERWWNNWLNTYLLLEKNTDIKALEAKFPAYILDKLGEAGTRSYEIYLQPLMDIHLGSTDITHDYQNWHKSDRSYVYIFMILAVFVLIIAGINFMNLSTARSVTRSREVGIRKTIGANKREIAFQFLGESVFFSFLGMVLAILIAELSLPYLNNLIQRELTLNLFSDWKLFLLVLAATLGVGLMAGFYPAIFISSFKPVKALKNEIKVGKGKISLQDGLVVVQFAISTAMVIGTILILQQLNYIQNKDIGLNKEQVLLLPMDRKVNEQYDALKQEFKSLSGVVDVTASRQRLGNNFHQGGMRFKGDTSVIQMGPSQIGVDMNYISFHNIEILKGREFSEEYSNDRELGYVLNEAMVKKLGWDVDEAVGKSMGGRDSVFGQVIGVAKDFHFNSLHHAVQPLVIYISQWGFSEISVKVDPKAMAGTIKTIEEKWRNTGTDMPFTYEFLDEHYDQLYNSDRQAAKVISIVAIITIIVACMGLFGLSTIAIEKRIKEIGIRKVLGASASGILVLIGKSFVKLILIAFVIASPLAFYFLDQWLGNFAYHTDIHWWIFVLAGLISLSIALMTVSYKALQAAKANPIESLRSE